jgi:ubiquinone/menaquinone biosynthesis C-methylase UbiE
MMTVNPGGEKRYEKVFGDTFAMYSKKDMEEFIVPFRVRFERNGINAKEIFSGRKCFDAGCGNGRGSLFMLMNGAQHVTAYDFSVKNVESTLTFANQFGFSNIAAMQGSLAQIPFEDETFDFVWCNGVIMHTEKPNDCLSELSRILKVNGMAWFYLYGSGGVYWYIINRIRSLLKEIEIEECISVLKLFRYETRYIAEFIDDWYSTWVRSYTHEDLSKRFMELGFEDPQLLKYGMDYDTSHRINMFSTREEKDLMGEGDLRYLLRKRASERSNRFLIKDGEYGSDYTFPALIKNNIDPIFSEIDEISENKNWMKIAIAAHIQRELRILLNDKDAFSVSQLVNILNGLIREAKNIKRV